MESIIGTTKGICRWCGRWDSTTLHHIIHAGVSKKTQEKMGLVCYLCFKCHRELHDKIPDEQGRDRDTELVLMAQKAWEKKFIENYPYENHARQAAREEWMRNIHKNYILEEEQDD